MLNLPAHEAQIKRSEQMGCARALLALATLFFVVKSAAAAPASISSQADIGNDAGIVKVIFTESIEGEDSLSGELPPMSGYPWGM